MDSKFLDHRDAGREGDEPTDTQKCVLLVCVCVCGKREKYHKKGFYA